MNMISIMWLEAAFYVKRGWINSNQYIAEIIHAQILTLSACITQIWDCKVRERERERGKHTRSKAALSFRRVPISLPSKIFSVCATVRGLFCICLATASATFLYTSTNWNWSKSCFTLIPTSWNALSMYPETCNDQHCQYTFCLTQSRCYREKHISDNTPSGINAPNVDRMEARLHGVALCDIFKSKFQVEVAEKVILITA